MDLGLVVVPVVVRIRPRRLFPGVRPNSLGERWSISRKALRLFGTLEGPMNGVRMLRSRLEGIRQPFVVEGVDGVACGLRIAA
jgi:hypothetical protein